jgi:hypothetical protein
MESILTSVKKLLGIDKDYTHFDNDLIMHINSVFMVLTQLGVGPSEGFAISDANTMWSDFIGEDDKNFQAIKTYVYMKVRLMFDPPLSSAVLDSMSRTICELEWRLNVQVDIVDSMRKEEIQNGV